MNVTSHIRTSTIAAKWRSLWPARSGLSSFQSFRTFFLLADSQRIPVGLIPREFAGNRSVVSETTSFGYTRCLLEAVLHRPRLLHPPSSSSTAVRRCSDEETTVSYGAFSATAEHAELTNTNTSLLFFADTHASPERQETPHWLKSCTIINDSADV